MNDSISTNIPSHAEELLEKYFFGEITEEEAGVLLELLENHPEIDETAKHNFEMDYFLRVLADPDPDMQIYVQSFALNDPFQNALRLNWSFFPQRKYRGRAPLTEKEKFRFSTDRRILGISGFLCLCGLLLLFFWPPCTFDQSRFVNPYEGTVAIVCESIDLKQQTSMEPIRVGEPLRQCTFSFASGTMEILFSKGTRCVVEGPADLTLLGDNQLFCRSGTLSVTVPRQGVGFELLTPHLNVIDLGTKFLADVAPESVAVHVVRGKVDIMSGAARLRQLSEGEAVTTKPGQTGTVSPTPLERDRFVTQEKVRELVNEKEFINEPDRQNLPVPFATPVVLFDLNSNSLAKNILLEGGTQIEGRSEGRRGFSLKKWSDAVRIDALPTSATFSMEMWVMIDRLEMLGNPLVMTDGKLPGGILWQFSSEGKMQFGIRESINQIIMYESPVVLTDDLLGKWVHLVAVLDSNRRMVTLYCNGSVVFAAPIKHSREPVLDSIALGNWFPRKSIGTNPAVNLNGTFDQFTIYDTALPSNEIKMKSRVIL
ncbi:MAG: LamG-like jellyroll fold domain-containing protein [Thermoguttaceae bacterium]